MSGPRLNQMSTIMLRECANMSCQVLYLINLRLDYCELHAWNESYVQESCIFVYSMSSKHMVLIIIISINLIISIKVPYRWFLEHKKCHL